jgi:glutamate formiminotransferase
MLIESIINISEGRDRAMVEAIARSAGGTLLDVHSDPDHHRSVLTLGGDEKAVEAASRAVVTEAVARLDLRTHQGAHPRFGVVDVVPFSPLDGDSCDEVVAVRDRMSRWEGTTLGVPCFRYGPERPLPEVRREAFRTLEPDDGPAGPHPTAGATAVGARPLMVAYNMWISVSEGGVGDAEAALSMAKEVAATIRSDSVRSLGLPVGPGAQVSCNLVDLESMGVGALFDNIAHLVSVAGGDVIRAELVGLIPAATLRDVPSHRWAELDLGEDRTIESRLEAGGVPIGVAGPP